MNIFFNKTCLTLSLLTLSSLALADDIYVAKDGDNNGDGSISSPYATISKAAEVAIAGDTVFIREGTYNETLTPSHSGVENSPIVFQAYENEKVIISAMEAINDWSLDSDNIYVADVAWNLGQLNFVMQNSTSMDLARWPNNVDGDPFTQNSLRNTGGSAGDVAIDAYLDYSSKIPDGDWSNGGSLYFYGDKPGSGWTTWRAFIKDNTQTRVTFDLNKSPEWIRTFHAPADKGDFFLQGIKEVLDYKNEWYFDPDTKKLYVMLPDGVKPSQDQIKMRKRTVTIDLSARHYVEINNLAVFGGSIELTNGASNNKIFGVTSLYGNYTLGVVRGFNSGSQSINIQNAVDNIIENSEVGFGSGSGIYDAGTNTQILNSYIHDFNYLGNYDAIINARNGKNTKVIGNTITRAGRDAIQAFNRNAEYAYNDVSFSNLIADDCGLLYTVGGPHNSIIHHNWFHDAYSSGSKKKAAGIYLDNNAEGFTVHHNVIWNTEWSNIQINWNGTDLNIYNNTLWNGSAVMGAWHLEGTEFSNVNVWNNLSNSSAWEPQSDKQNNLTVSSSPFVDYIKGDFRLKSGSSPINAGKFITDITTDVTDGEPDVGAYEVMGENSNWVAGITWKKTLGPTGNGCYGLPGETCENDTIELPTANFSTNATVDEGGETKLSVSLSAAALNYPVTIPYNISGTANSDDHNLTATNLIIESGTEGSFSITINTDALEEADETLILTMGEPTNANIGTNNKVTITISDKTEVAPSVPTPAPDPTPSKEEKSSGGSASWLMLISVLGLFARKKAIKTARKTTRHSTKKKNI